MSTTNVYDFSFGQLNKVDLPQYNEAPELQLQQEGFTVMPNSKIGTSVTYTSENRARPFAVSIANGDCKYIIFMHRIEDYISYFRQWGMLSHVIHFILPTA